MAKCPKIRIPAGSDVAIVEIKGDPKNPEPAHVRIAFPGGDVEVTRTTEGSYWVHIRRNRAVDCVGNDAIEGVIEDARLDITGKHASGANVGDFGSPGLYHLAVRVGAKKG